MKILVSVTLNGRSAGTWYAVETARRFQSRGHDVLCLPRPQGKTIAIARKAGLRVLDDCDLGATTVGTFYPHIRRLIRLAREYEPDVILAHWGTDHLLWAMAKTMGRLAIPLVRVRALDPRPPNKHLFSRWLHRSPTDHVVTVNSRLFEAYRKRLRLPRERLSVITAGVEASDCEGRESADLASLGVPAGKTVVVLLARFSPVKGHRVLLKSIRTVVDRLPDVHFLWLGFPSEYNRDLFARWFVEANLTEQITVVDEFVPDVHAVLRSCALGLVTSIGSESVSRSLLEYLSCGLPVVATDVGGVTDLMQRGDFGMLVPPDDSPALADAIIRILESPDRGAAQGERGRSYASKQGTWDQRIDEWEDLLAKLRVQNQSSP
ncbi:MAG: glycosyltransferase family 4 protein [Candidatus Zixiibacteriota bacterium]